VIYFRSRLYYVRDVVVHDCIAYTFLFVGSRLVHLIVESVGAREEHFSRQIVEAYKLSCCSEHLVQADLILKYGHSVQIVGRLRELIKPYVIKHVFDYNHVANLWVLLNLVVNLLDFCLENKWLVYRRLRQCDQTEFVFGQEFIELLFLLQVI